MNFTSPLFVFIVLPAVLGIYWICPDRFRNPVLLAAGISLYAWGAPEFVAVVLVLSVFDWLLAFRIAAAPLYNQVFFTLLHSSPMGRQFAIGEGGQIYGGVSVSEYCVSHEPSGANSVRRLRAANRSAFGQPSEQRHRVSGGDHAIEAGDRAGAHSQVPVCSR